LDHRFDDQVAVGQIAEVVGRPDPAEDLVALADVQLALADLLVETDRQAVERRVGRRPGPRSHDHLAAGPGSYLGQTGAHDPGPDDAHPLDDRSVHGRMLPSGKNGREALPLLAHRVQVREIRPGSLGAGMNTNGETGDRRGVTRTAISGPPNGHLSPVPCLYGPSNDARTGGHARRGPQLP